MKRIAFLLIIMTILLTACGGNTDVLGDVASSPVYNDILKISSYEGIQTVDPAYVHNKTEIEICNLVYEGLVKDVNGEIKPSLAKSWDISNDGLVYTFYLRDKVYFHNGKEMTADDVQFSFARVLRQKLAGSYVFTDIVGADQVLSGASIEIPGIKTSGNYVLQIHLNAADPNFLHGLAMPTAKVLDRLELVDQGVDFGRSSTVSTAYPLPSGTGPYRLAEWQAGSGLSLGSFANYYGDKPYPERIEYSFDSPEDKALLQLKAGTISLVTDAVSAKDVLKDESNAFQIIDQPVRDFRYLVINPEAVPFNNVQLRKAIFDAISPTDMITAVRKGHGVFPQHDFCGYWNRLDQPGTVVGEDTTNQAKTELASAGYPGGVGLGTLTLLCGPTAEDKSAAKYIVDTLAKRGVEIQVESLSYLDLNHRIREGNAAFYIDEFADKDGGLDAFFKERVSGSWQNTIKAGTWSESLNQAFIANDTVKNSLFSQVEQDLYNQGVLYCLYYEMSSVATTNAFKGLKVNNDGSFDFSTITKNSRKNE